MPDIIPPCEFPSWIWNEELKRWEAPIPYPDTENWTKMFGWDETTQTWVLIGSSK